MILLVFVWLVALQTLFALPANQFYSAKVAVCFSPNGGCTDAIVKEIEKAKDQIVVQAYYFTSAPIAEALIKAARKRIAVRVIVDPITINNQTSVLPALAAAEIPIFVDREHAIAHNKVIAIDHSTVITGSFNFTKGAEEKNAENLPIIKDAPEITWLYLKNFISHLKHSIPLEQWEEEHKP